MSQIFFALFHRLSLLLQSIGFVHVIERLVINKTVAAVLLGKAIGQVILVFKHPPGRSLVIPM